MFTSLEAELGAILHISQIISNKIFRGKRIVVCTDSLEAMDLIFSGSYLCSEVLIKGKKIQELVNSLFCLNFVSKDNNSDADSLVFLSDSSVVGSLSQFLDKVLEENLKMKCLELMICRWEQQK